MGVPSFGRTSHREELIASAPASEVLGTVASDSPLVSPTVDAPVATASWTTPEGTVMDLTEPPPPWEQVDARYDASDARQYVDVPPNWVLRWVNPRLLESSGWRDWQPVLVNDSRVKVKVSQMESPDGNIRRGGATGDILAWMYRSWVESRRKEHLEKTRRQTDAAMRKQEELRDEFRRGSFGPYVRIEDAKHPTHTQFDGRSVRD